MTPLRRPALPLAAVAAFVALMLGGCAPAPPPRPSVTPAFASEAEAFAAAEEVYRAYLDAAAARAADSPVADPQSYLSGVALSGDIDAQRVLAEAGLKIVGASQVIDFTGVRAKTDSAVALVVADICVDLRDSRVVNQRGVDVTPSDRADTSLLRVEFAGSESSLLITRSTSRESRC